VECALGIVCNKWRIFHRAIDVCPNFYDFIVNTCCILHNFGRQRDGFQFQDNLNECTLESITDVGNRGNATKQQFHSLTRLSIILPGVKPSPVCMQFAVQEVAHGTVHVMPTGCRCPLSVLLAKPNILILQDKLLRYQPLSVVKHRCETKITF
jgi:hypothetical protein